MSSDDALNKYSVWCLTDNKEVISDYRFEPPTSCPENDSHPIDTDPTKLTIVASVTKSTVIIKEDPGPTQGNFSVAGRYVTINDTINSETNIDASFPYHIGVHSIILRPGPANIGDKVDMYSIVPTPIGALIAPGAISDTVLYVSPTIFTYVNVGFEFTISDGVNTQFLGECQAYNKLAGTITITNALTNNYSPLSPSYLSMRIRKAKDVYFVTEKSIGIGTNIAGSSILPPGIVGRIVYTNLTGGAKKFAVNMNYIY